MTEAKIVAVGVSAETKWKREFIPGCGESIASFLDTSSAHETIGAMLMTDE